MYARLPEKEITDYEKLKQALLKRFNLTEEGFRTRFRSAKPEGGETPLQFITRMESYLIRWLELAKMAKTYEGLKTLMLREQYINVCHKDLAMFLKERGPVGIPELARLAEQYLDAHKNISQTRQSQEDSKIVQSIAREAVPNATYHKGPTSQKPTPKCYNCGRMGHIARNCFRKVSTAAMGEIAAFVEQPRAPGYRSSQWQRYGHNTRPVQQSSIYSPRMEAVNTSADTEPKQLMDQSNLTVCRAHHLSNCMRCLVTEHTPGYPCNALLCPEFNLECGCKVPVIAEACNISRQAKLVMPVVQGRLNGQDVSVLRDTGCSTVVVRRDLITDDQLTGQSQICVLIDGTVRRTPVARIELETPYFTGTVLAVCMKQPLYDVIVGNIEGAENPDVTDNLGSSTYETEQGNHTDVKQQVSETGAVTTRSQAKKKHVDKPLKVTKDIDLEVTKDRLMQLQQEDESLKNAWSKSESVDSEYLVKNGLLHKVIRSKFGNTHLSVVVPVSLRQGVLSLGHDAIMSGHQGVKRTYDRIVSQFYWPGMHGDIKRYCQSCDICQKTVSKGRVANVPLGTMPLIETPFQRVAVDIVGPIMPLTERGHRYILTVVDYATRYPEAVALKNIETTTVAEALVTIFARVGIPHEILSDQGVQFTSSLMKEVSRLLSIKQMVTTPYHPICNGLVERFNGTLKAMLRKMCSERPSDWDRYLAPLLFAYREVPQESTGYSPFQLLYGRSVRGPMTVLKELWTNEQTVPEVKTTYEYVLDLQDRLKETCELARAELGKAQHKQRKYYNTKTRERVFKAGDRVLLLLPSDNNKLLMQWKGPYCVLERVNANDYKIQMPGRTRTMHANLLKKYYERRPEGDSVLALTATCVVEGGESADRCRESEPDISLYSHLQSETYQDVHINPELPDACREEVEAIFMNSVMYSPTFRR